VLSDKKWKSNRDGTCCFSIGAAGRKLIMGYFSGNIQAFEAFHHEQDDEEYLEIKEYIEKFRMECAQQIIEAFCKAQGIIEAHDISKAGADLEDLIGELLGKSRILHRKIATLLGISASRVHQVSRQSN